MRLYKSGTFSSALEVKHVYVVTGREFELQLKKNIGWGKKEKGFFVDN